MATTITAATLTVTITEALALGGNNYNTTTKKEIASIGNIHKRIYTLTAATSHTIAEFASTITGTKFDLEDTKYIRITNLDDTNSIVVSFTGASVTSGLVVPPGGSAMLFDYNINAAASATTLTSGAAIASMRLHNLGSVAADCEVVIATL